MDCPRCYCPETHVTYTRSKINPAIIYRRRRCANQTCLATFRTWERLDPGDACRGRRPGEPRRVLGRPRKTISPPAAQGPVVEITEAAEPALLYPPEDWRERFTAEARRIRAEIMSKDG
jgi:hypothetical protein